MPIRRRQCTPAFAEACRVIRAVYESCGVPADARVRWNAGGTGTTTGTDTSTDTTTAATDRCHDYIIGTNTIRP